MNPGQKIHYHDDAKEIISTARVPLRPLNRYQLNASSVVGFLLSPALVTALLLLRVLHPSQELQGFRPKAIIAWHPDTKRLLTI